MSMANRFVRDANMTGFVVINLPSLDPQAQAMSDVTQALPVASLEHGAYYAGKLNASPIVARWHAKKRRFVFEEYAVGRKHTRSVAHVQDCKSGDGFAPLAMASISANGGVSDYAFETAG